MKKIFQWLNKLEVAILCLLLVSMTLLVFIEVVMRFGFNQGLIWAEEATLYLGAWLVLFGASYGVKTGAHIGVDAFVKTLPSLYQRSVALLTIVLCLVYCGLFIYGGWIYLSKLKMIGLEMEDLPIPKWQASSILVIGFVLLAIRFIQAAIQLIKGETNTLQFANEAKESMSLAKEGSKD
ncbi:TRAP transporter small permease [Spartinivicinus poritis]|uniref:TRAP transporter small permease protein n=1 Tax=Spartinivicinus poritis TaxID=2994640 RepID=A0ABT5UDQ4_9GAMM|nr:TRAP transporter small permease [Spartinivicinus sp. A2-2]MDE1464483.1 TRAP transporter small permease [Spartinivicinus sp. A2-2]